MTNQVVGLAAVKTLLRLPGPWSNEIENFRKHVVWAQNKLCGITWIENGSFVSKTDRSLKYVCYVENEFVMELMVVNGS